MERSKKNTRGMTKCMGCRRFVKSIRRHLAQTQCSLIYNRNTLQHNTNNVTTPRSIIGSNIGFQIDYNPPNNQIDVHTNNNTSLRSQLLARQCRVPRTSNIGTIPDLHDLPMPDFQSISVLSVQTGEQTADIHHTQLRELN